MGIALSIIGHNSLHDSGISVLNTVWSGIVRYATHLSQSCSVLTTSVYSRPERFQFVRVTSMAYSRDFVCKAIECQLCPNFARVKLLSIHHLQFRITAEIDYCLTCTSNFNTKAVLVHRTAREAKAACPRDWMRKFRKWAVSYRWSIVTKALSRTVSEI